MLNPFPELLNFSLLAPLLIRVVIGVLFLRFGIKKISKNHSGKCVEYFTSLGLKKAKTLTPIIGFVEIVSAVALILGFLTQIAAIILALISIFTFLLLQRKNVRISHTSDFYFLLFIVLVGLILTGAGTFAFDLPL